MIYSGVLYVNLCIYFVSLECSIMITRVCYYDVGQIYIDRGHNILSVTCLITHRCVIDRVGLRVHAIDC